MPVATFDHIETIEPTLESASSPSKRPPEDTRDRASRRLSRIVPLLALLGYAVVAVCINLDVWTSPTARYIGGGGDPQQTMWFLSWTPFAITHGHNPFLSDYMRYPGGIDLLWQTAIPAAGLVLAPITALWGPVATYNVLMTSGLAAGGWMGFFAVRRFVPGNIAPVVGGLIYGFSPFAIAQSQGHTHLIASMLTPPLVLLLLHDLFVRQERRPAVLGSLIAGVAVLQFFLAEEVLATEVIVCALATAVAAALHWHESKQRAGYVSRTLVVAAALIVVVLAYPMATQFLGPDRVAGAIHDPQVFVTDPANLFIPTPVQWIAPPITATISSHFSGNISEWDGYLGLPLVVLGVFAFVRYWRMPLVRAVALTTMAICFLSLGGYVHLARHSLPIPLPWRVAERLPVLNNILPSRLMMYAFLGAGIVVAFVLHRLWSARRSAWFNIGLTGLVIIPLVPHVPLDSTPVAIPTYYTSSAVREVPQDTVVLSVPWAANTNPSPMLGQAASGMRFRLLGGYFIGDDDPTQTHLRATVDDLALRGVVPAAGSARQQLVAEMREDHVGAVIVGPSPQEAAAVAFFTTLLGPPNQSVGAINVWRTP